MYNSKKFLAPDSITSMSAIHLKQYEDGKAIVRISDCHGSIRLWNNLNEVGAKDEMINKLDVLIDEISRFKTHLQNEKS